MREKRETLIYQGILYLMHRSQIEKTPDRAQTSTALSYNTYKKYEQEKRNLVDNNKHNPQKITNTTPQ